MRIMIRFAIAAALVAGVSLAAVAQQPDWQYPVIAGYGPAMALPNAAVQPDTSLTYKIIFDIGSGKTEGDEKYNSQLAHVARLINVFAVGGMKPDRMKLVAVVHGDATPIVLTDDHYQAKFGAGNPNTKLIGELKAAGVVLFVCGQSLGDYAYQPDWVNKDITLALSSQVVVPTYELMGYAYMP